MKEEEKDNVSLENEEIKSDEKKETKQEEKKTEKKSKGVFSKNSDKKLNEEIDLLNQKNAEIQDKYLRLVAEYDNYRKRTTKEKIEISEYAKSKLLLDFLPVVDDIERAIQHIDQVKDLDATIEGIKIINHKFSDFLKSQGIEEIEAKDQDFDTDLHEAITRFPTENEAQKGKVIDVLQKGYKLKDKVIRFSKVVVGE